MYLVGTACRSGAQQPVLRDLLRDRIDPCRSENESPLGFDEPDLACPIGHVRWHRRLELAVPDEHDQRMDLVLAEVQERFQRLDMLVILVQKILKLELLLENLLRPLALARLTEDPALHVLRLNDEDTVLGHDDLIDLRRAIGRRKGHVADQAIFSATKEKPSGEIDNAFTDNALEPGRLQDSGTRSNKA